MTLITDLLSGDAALQDFYVADGTGGIIEADIVAWAEAQGVMRIGTYDPNNDGSVTNADLSANATSAYTLEGHAASYFEPSLAPNVKNDLGAWSWSHGLGKAVYRPGVQIYEDFIHVDDTVVLGRDPQIALEAATKQYVDSMVQGFHILTPVRVTTSNNAYFPSGYLVIDGVKLQDGDRVLLKDQQVDEGNPGSPAVPYNTATANGVYVVASGLWARSEDMKGSSDPEPAHGMYLFVTEGNSNTNTGWVLTTPDPIVIDTTELEFTLFTSTTRDYFAGDGLNLSENTFSVEYGTNTVSIYEAALSEGESAGNSTYVARIDHGHYHGQLTGQFLHNLVSSTTHGFMSSADKIKIDTLDPNAGANQNTYSFVYDGITTFSAGSETSTLLVGEGLETHLHPKFGGGVSEILRVKPGIAGEVLITTEVPLPQTGTEPSATWATFNLGLLAESPDDPFSAHIGEALIVDATGTKMDYLDIATIGNQNAYSFVSDDLGSTISAMSATATLEVSSGLSMVAVSGSGGEVTHLGITRASVGGQVMFSSLQGGFIEPAWRTLDSSIIDDIPNGYFSMSSARIKGTPFGLASGQQPEDLDYLDVIKVLKNEDDSTVFTGTFEFPGNWGVTHTLVFVNGLLESHDEVVV